MIAVLLLAVLQAQDPGVVPATAEGRALNLGFEAGTFQDWGLSGQAFGKQPSRGDLISRRRGDMKSDHAGEYWVGSYEAGGDELKGTLTSLHFKVTHPYGSFRVAGGPRATTRVDVLLASDDSVLLTTNGMSTENLRRVVVDLRAHVGRKIFIRIVDEDSGPWGHINFDDFRFHEKPPQEAAPKPLLDDIRHAGLPPEEAARAMTVPEGFQVTAFAGEPEVHQPIAMAIDDRGRLWVAENHAYPIWVPPGSGKDRIVIFEDADNDGRHDKKAVFIEGLNFVSGLEVGFGGVWVGSPPHLLFIPDKNGDDKPDGEPQVLLDGWEHHDTHEMLNTFTWGPDGWLYGCHGVFTRSLVGKPGDAPEKRVPINAGIWRYHPTKHLFEIFAEGGSNQWGLDFNDNGQAFMTACVIPHLYHVIQGARYQRQGGKHSNPHVYDDIKTIADHRHYVGDNPHKGNNRSDSAGGGHAHAGAMIYQGGLFPPEYRNAIFMNNIHGARINVDLLERTGSGFTGRHGKDFLFANDRWSQVLNLQSGPDGSVFMIDWYDKQACHTMNPAQHDRTNGRVFKVAYGRPSARGDLAALPDSELAERMLDGNEWHVRHSRRLLQERGSKEIRPRLEEIAFRHESESRNLRGLWALHVTGGLAEEQVARGLRHASAYVRAWTVQLACEDRNPSEKTIRSLETLAREDGSPVVRLYLAASGQRLPVDRRWGILEALACRGEDAGDPNIPLMIWYALEPCVAADGARAAGLAGKARIPRVREFVARRMAAGSK